MFQTALKNSVFTVQTSPFRGFAGKGFHWVAKVAFSVKQKLLLAYTMGHTIAGSVGFTYTNASCSLRTVDGQNPAPLRAPCSCRPLRLPLLIIGNAMQFRHHVIGMALFHVNITWVGLHTTREPAAFFVHQMGGHVAESVRSQGFPLVSPLVPQG